MLIHRFLFRQVDTASLAVFRMMFGAMLLFEAVNYGVFLCLDCMYRDTDLLFKYPFFEWVSVPTEPWFRLSYALLGVAAIGVITGTFYRLSMLACTLLFTWHFLLDQSLYLNHFYMVILICVILCFAPANRLWSVDAWRNAAIRSETVPNWSRFWLCAQLEIILLYAGFVKINHDWLNLEPMRLWMTRRSQDEAAIFQFLTQDWGIAAASYGAIALHLIGAPLLLWRRTRLAVFCLYAFFHLTNAMVFDIGIFPFMTLAATLLLFDPDWPRQVARWWQARRASTPKPFWNAITRPAISTPPARGSDGAGARGVSLLIVSGISIWLLLQIAVPLRHFAAPGNVAWNEDGHQFSWRMKLRSKQGSARFIVVDEAGKRTVVDPADHLNPRQVRTLSCLPDLIWQFAQFLEEHHRATADQELKVYAQANCSLNDRPPASLINNRVDLTAIDRNEPVTNWTLPLTTPLRQTLF